MKAIYTFVLSVLLCACMQSKGNDLHEVHPAQQSIVLASTADVSGETLLDRIVMVVDAEISFIRPEGWAVTQEAKRVSDGVVITVSMHNGMKTRTLAMFIAIEDDGIDEQDFAKLVVTTEQSLNEQCIDETALLLDVGLKEQFAWLVCHSIQDSDDDEVSIRTHTGVILHKNMIPHVLILMVGIWDMDDDAIMGRIMRELISSIVLFIEV